MRMAFDKATREYEDSYKFDIEIFNYQHTKVFEKATKKIDDAIKEYKNKIKTAFMVVVHSEMTIKRLASMGLSILNGEVPNIKSSLGQEENQYPVLDWSYFAIGHFCRRSAYLNDWFEEKSSFAKYSSIPVGNLQNDTESQIIDVLYSRSLQKGKHLLWYSDSDLPDLGGNEDAHSRRYLFDQLDSNIEISNPGFYRTYCVEIDISLLCINAILQAEYIYEFGEVSTSNQKIDKNKEEIIDLHNRLSEDIDSPESCIPAFLKLKAVVSQWIDDIKRGNIFADILVQHLFRWLSSTESKLYDPQLFNFVNFLIKKCFSELIEKFKSRDAVIIFATFNKIIIETKRPDTEQTMNYVNFIVDSLEKIEIFKYLKYNIRRTWKILMFKDRFNYCGIDLEQSDNKIS